MIKLSVKKPYTVLVLVIAILMLAAVSLTQLTTDLLPEISMPYLIVITTDPGASPEKVETEVTEIIESSLSTVNNVKTFSSTSAENYSMTMLEFEENTDMDAALVKVYTALDSVADSLPDTASTPNVMEISMSMMATMYVSISSEDMDIYELTDYVNDEVSPYFQRQDGVASVSTIGLVEEMIEVRLDKDKIDALNDTLVATISDELADAKAELDEAQEEIDSGKEKLDQASESLSTSETETADELATYTKQLNEALATKAAYEATLTSLQASKTALETELAAYKEADVAGNYKQINQLFATLQTTLSDTTAAAYYGYSASQVPTDINDALSDSTKLANAVAVLNAMGQSEAAASLTTDTLQSLSDANTRIPQIETELANLSTEISANQAVLDSVNDTIDTALENYEDVEAGKITASAAFGSSAAEISAGQSSLDEAQAQLDEAYETYETSRDTALENANLDALLSLDTLSSLIYAQNFSMPAGYISDENDDQWLLKVGTEISSLEELQNLVLTNIDGIGDITLSDVATITVIDNSSDSYSRMNGNPAILLSIYKASTAGTSSVSDTLNEAIASLQTQDTSLTIVPLMDQGEYIDMFLSNIVSNMLWGALLAMIVLVLFLHNIKPTLVVAFSIPFSVLLAVLIMYFTGLTLNIMSMSGLALGIGMLVDNSIVVIENIYRLRGHNLPAARAAVWGGRQVASAIISSTLTTICVFLPMIFTSGLVRSLMVPFALTISFSLIASLLVALSVVPAMGSALLKNTVPKSSSTLEKIQDVYERMLRFFLRFKVLPIALAVILLVVSGWAVSKMGIVLIPDMNSDQLFVTAQMDEDLDMDSCYAKADEIADILLNVDSVDSVGVMTNLSSAISGSLTTSENDYTFYSFYLVLDESVETVNDLNTVTDELESLLVSETDCEITISQSSAGDMSSLMSSGLSVNIYGKDTETLESISEDIMALVEEINGFTDVSNGLEDMDTVIHVEIDRNEAMRCGLTVAEIYSTLSTNLTTENSSTSLTFDDETMDVDIVDECDTLTLENLMDQEFTVTSTNASGEEETTTYTLSDFATAEEEEGLTSINSENGTHMMTVSATTEDGYNTTRLSEKFEKKLASYEVPDGYSVELSGEVEEVQDMVTQMIRLLLLGLVLVYLIMVAQFQSLLSPFIILFTVPLAFTGGLLGLLITGQQISIVSLFGFLVLMGTVVNNGIVLVDYVNQLRIAGLEKHEALVAAGKTRMRPIAMTALTTILAMGTMVVSDSISSSLSKGMAVVVAGGLLYATLMTLFIVPVLYDIFFRGNPHVVEISEDIEDAPDDAHDYLASHPHIH